MLRMQHPEDLTNDHIQKLGKDYSEKFGDNEGFFHGHQLIAKELKKYNQHTTSEEKWYFLANTYLKLGNHNGYLAVNIRHLFYTTFNREPMKIFYYKENEPSMRQVKEHLESLTKQYFLEKECRNCN